MYVSLYKLSIERYYIEGLYEVTYNCITSGLSRSTTCTRTPDQPAPGNDHRRHPPAGQQIRKPPNLHPEARRSVIVGESPAKVADLRAGKSLVIVGKSKVAGKSPAKVAHSSESEDS